MLRLVRMLVFSLVAATPAAGMMVSLDDACPCDTTAGGAAWMSHREYVSCVTTEARSRLREHALRARDMRAAVRAAKASSCGNAALTRCCVYRNEDDEVGSCRLMRPDDCDALDGDTVETDDAGSGSCVPNPCAF
jgi:hypothetical protein